MDVVGGHEGHGHSMVVADLVETDGFEAVGFFETKAVCAGSN